MTENQKLVTGRERIGSFLLQLQCKHGLSKTATTFVAEELEQIIEHAVQEGIADTKSMPTAQEACQEFSSAHKLMKYCHGKIEYVPPTTVMLSAGVDEESAGYQYVDLPVC